MLLFCIQDPSSPKLDPDDVAITDTNDDRIERGARTIVENTHYITVPGNLF